MFGGFRDAVSSGVRERVTGRLEIKFRADVF